MSKNSQKGGDGVDRGKTTGEQFQHFVYWAVTRHPEGEYSNKAVLKILKAEFPNRLNEKKWPNKRRRCFQNIADQRAYAKDRPRNGRRHKLGIRDEVHGRQILARIDRMMHRGSSEGVPIPISAGQGRKRTAAEEGNSQIRLVTVHERSPQNRRLCLQHHGYRCKACDQDLEELYGPVGFRVIHVHHERELSTLGSGYVPDPVNEMKPLCPNCHAIIHAGKGPAMSVARLRRLVKRRRSEKA